MAYNIDNWKVKELKDLVIPVKHLYPEGYKNWHPSPPAFDINSGRVTILGGAEGFMVIGKVSEGMIHVERIQNYGEGSGSFMSNVLIPALKQSKGTLVVACVWEGGDSLSRLSVKNGVVNDENIDI